MAPEVEVALVGVDLREVSPPPFLPWPRLDDDSSRPWNERRRVTLAVDGNETLGSLLDRAVAEFDLYETKDWAALGHGTGRFIALRDDNSPLPLAQRLRSWLTLVDGSGHAEWGVSVDYEDIPYSRLTESVAAGTVKGDPTKIYLKVRFIPAGGGVFADWGPLIQAWQVALDVAGTIQLLQVGADVIARVRERLSGKRVVEIKMSDWLSRGGWIYSLEETLGGEPWLARDLAGLLGCTTSEAEQVLSLYGYTEQRGTWLLTAGDPTRGIAPTDLPARVVVAYRREVIYSFLDQEVDDEVLADLFGRILKEAADTGEVTALRYEDNIESIREWFR